MTGSVGTDVVRIGQDVAWTSDEERVVALDLADLAATPFALENSAAVVWQEIADAGEIAVDDLIDMLLTIFDDAPIASATTSNTLSMIWWPAVCWCGAHPAVSERAGDADRQPRLTTREPPSQERS